MSHISYRDYDIIIEFSIQYPSQIIHYFIGDCNLDEDDKIRLYQKTQDVERYCYREYITDINLLRVDENVITQIFSLCCFDTDEITALIDVLNSKLANTPDNKSISGVNVNKWINILSQKYYTPSTHGKEYNIYSYMYLLKLSNWDGQKYGKLVKFDIPKPVWTKELHLTLVPRESLIRKQAYLLLLMTKFKKPESTFNLHKDLVMIIIKMLFEYNLEDIECLIYRRNKLLNRIRNTIWPPTSTGNDDYDPKGVERFINFALEQCCFLFPSNLYFDKDDDNGILHYIIPVLNKYCKIPYDEPSIEIATNRFYIALYVIVHGQTIVSLCSDKTTRICKQQNIMVSRRDIFGYNNPHKTTKESNLSMIIKEELNKHIFNEAKSLIKYCRRNKIKFADVFHGRVKLIVTHDDKNTIKMIEHMTY